MQNIAREGHMNHYNAENMHENLNLMNSGVAVNKTAEMMTPNSENKAAVQAAVVNLATAMRMGAHNFGNITTNLLNNEDHPMPTSPNSLNSARLANPNLALSHQQNQLHQHQLSQHQNSAEESLRIHQAEAILRSQAEAALRLAVSQAAAVVASSSSSSDVIANTMRLGNNGNLASNYNQPSPNMNQQNQDILAQQQQSQQQQQQQQQVHNNQLQNHQLAQQNQQSQNPDLSDVLRIQEHRLEQALRLQSGDPRMSFSLANQQQHT